MTIRPITIFYSWQSDLRNDLNRSFIEDVLERAAKGVKLRGVESEAPFDFIAAVDRDTQGHLGTPDIAATIFTKIQSADIFIGDVSIVSNGAGRIGSAANQVGRVFGIRPRFSTRATPNPNVMTELGFAAGALGWDRVVCICNETYGSIEQLPFDLRGRSVIPYRLGSGQKKAEVRKELVGKLKARLAPLFQSAWLAHRPHPLRFAAYEDISLLANRFLGLIAHLHVQSRSAPTPDKDWRGILSEDAIQYTVEWTNVDAEVPAHGPTLVGSYVVQCAAELRREVGNVLTRYGDRIAPDIYEALSHVERGMFLVTLEHFHALQRLDLQEGIPRPRILASYIHFTERDLRALAGMAEWRQGERAVLSRFEKDLRPFTSPDGHAGTPGLWRIDNAERQRQLDRWNDPARGRSEPSEPA